VSVRHQDVLPEARRLAELLPGIKRSSLSMVVSDFDGDPERLRLLLQLIAQGSGGHTERGDGYGDQLKILAEVLPGFLADCPLPVEALPGLFGWTGRLLKIRETPMESGSAGGGSGGGRKRSSSPGSGPGRGAPRRTEKPGSGKAEARSWSGSLGGKNLAELKKLLGDDN